jgi:hypothetical protein
MLDGVCMVWTGLLEKPLEVVPWRPCRTLVVARGGQDASHARAACFPVTAVIMDGRDRGPLEALHAPLVAAFDALLGAASGNVKWRLLVTAQGCLPVSLCGVKHDHLVAGGVLGGDAAPLLKCASEEVPMSTFSWALCVAFGQRACATQASMAVNLGFIAPTLAPPYQGMGREICRGDGSSLIMDGVTLGLGRLVPA